MSKAGLHINGHVVSYLICVVFAAILWVFNALSKEYTSEVTYPVKYTDLPKGKYIVSELPQSMTLEVKTSGFSLLRHKMGTSFLPVTIDVNVCSDYVIERTDALRFTLRLNEVKDKISSRFSPEIQIQNIRPQEIDFIFSRAASRKVPIVSAVKYQLRKQYILKDGVVVAPDSALVTGPAAIIDTLSCLYTERKDLGEVRKEMSERVRVAVVGGLSSSVEDVQVSMRTERYTEAQRTLPVRIVGMPDTVSVRLFPTTVDITYDVGLSMYDKISDADFSFVVNYRDVGKSEYLPVQAERVPAYVTNLVFSPQRVEYILEEK